MIMSGASRMAYHAVPRVLAPWCHAANKLPACLGGADLVPDDKWAPVADYLSTSRINMNVRQVLKSGCPFPLETEDETVCNREAHQLAAPKVLVEKKHSPENTVASSSAEKNPPDHQNASGNNGHNSSTAGAAKKRCIQKESS